MRPPAVSGAFYPDERDELIRAIENSFKHPLGPGKLPSPTHAGTELKALIVPHAGYAYSGPIAAHAYAELSLRKIPEVIIILGVNHYGYGEVAGLSPDDFETPLGVSRINKGIYQKLKDNGMKEDRVCHVREHSIEVQLPFIQYIYGSNFTFVAISLSYMDTYNAKKTASIIKKAIDGVDALVIASTDFSHYVPKRIAYSMDKKAIEKIEEHSPDGLYKVVNEYNISMCGVGPVLTLLYTLDNVNMKLLKYATSGDVVDMGDVVGYGAFKGV
ncbi:MAG: AmmeMemoRadiSam system protein B [Thermoplasmata archaeon]